LSESCDTPYTRREREIGSRGEKVSKKKTNAGGRINWNVGSKKMVRS